MVCRKRQWRYRVCRPHWDGASINTSSVIWYPRYPSRLLQVCEFNPRSRKTSIGTFHQIGKATTLLAFMAGSPMSPDHITGKVEGSGNALEVLVALRDAKYCEHENGNNFYMLRNDMGADLGAVLTKWFELYDTFAAPSQLALSVLNSKDLWLHVEFLSLMQALEGFHRATMPGLYTTESEFETSKSHSVMQFRIMFHLIIRKR